MVGGDCLRPHTARILAQFPSPLQVAAYSSDPADLRGKIRSIRFMPVFNQWGASAGKLTEGKGDSFAFMWGPQAVVAHPLLWGRVVTVPQEATLAFNEPILILLPSVCKLFISPHTTYIYIYCKSTHSHALHTGNHRAQAERANFCPSGTGKLIPDKWRASYIPLKTGFQSHLNHMLL